MTESWLNQEAANSVISVLCSQAYTLGLVDILPWPCSLLAFMCLSVKQLAFNISFNGPAYFQKEAAMQSIQIKKKTVSSWQCTRAV